MKDIRLATTFWDHWKTLFLQSSLGLEAPVCLQRLWCFAAIYKPDGKLTGMNAKAIELACRWPGNPESLVGHLVDLGFLEVIDGVYVLHDWATHNGYVATANARSEKAKNNANKRWNSRFSGRTPDAKNATTDASSNASSNASSIARKDASSNASSNADGNAPYPSPYPSPSHKKEEKQKELSLKQERGRDDCASNSEREFLNSDQSKGSGSSKNGSNSLKGERSVLAEPSEPSEKSKSRHEADKALPGDLASIDPNFNPEIPKWWKDAQSLYCKAKPSSCSMDLTRSRRTLLHGALIEVGFDRLLKAWQWILESPHESAAFIRDRGGIDTLLKPDHIRGRFF
jgi:hypothetical protein